MSRVHKGESIRVFPLSNLDGAGHLAIYTFGKHPYCAVVFCQGTSLCGD